MDIETNGGENNTFGLWPLEHPIEPMEEDQPIKYPILDTSALKEKKACEKLRRKTRFEEVIDKKEMASGKEDPSRKRHHTAVTQQHYPLFPFTANNNDTGTCTTRLHSNVMLMKMPETNEESSFLIGAADHIISSYKA